MFQGCYILLLQLPAQSTPAFVAVPVNIHRSAAQNLRCAAQPAVFDANKRPFFGNAECRVCVFWIGCREELPVNTTYSQIAFAALHLKTGNHQRHLKTDFTEATHLLRWLCFYLAELPVAAQGNVTLQKPVSRRSEKPAPRGRAGALPARLTARRRRGICHTGLHRACRDLPQPAGETCAR